MKAIEENTHRYVQLSREVPLDGTLIIWPESVLQEWIRTGTGQAGNDPRIPFLDQGSAMLIGSLTFDSPKRYFNSALAIYPTGEIPYPYHKRILMPFGEYTPLGRTLPWIKAINSTAADFTPGAETVVFPFPLGTEEPAKVAPLICYEDVIPHLAREATLRGATLLVNMTNDAWFGDTAEPFEHHLIASFRAIENGRYLLRSTNSGLTAIVNPLGITEASLPTFSDGVLVREVRLFEDQTVYTLYVGEKPWWILTFVGALLILNRRRSAGRRL